MLIPHKAYPSPGAHGIAMQCNAVIPIRLLHFLEKGVSP